MKMDLLAKYDDYDKYVNCLISKILRIGILFMLTALCLNEIGIFIINRKAMYIVTLISIIIFMIPTILFDRLKLHTRWAQYLVLLIMTLTSGMMYAFLSYHVVIMFVVPVCIACLYHNKRYPLMTMIMTIPVLIIAHFIAYELKLVPDEPLVSVRGVICFGIIPRLIQFIGCSLISIGAADRSSQLIKQLLAAHHKQSRDQEVLKQIIYESEQLIGIRKMDEMIRQSNKAITAVLEKMGNTHCQGRKTLGGYTIPNHEVRYCFVQMNEVTYYKADELPEGDTLMFKDKPVALYETHLPQYEVTIIDGVLGMRFYENGQIIGFLFVECELSPSVDNMNMLKTLHTNIHKSLKNAYLNEEMVVIQKQLIQSLAEICESKSDQTGQHIKRVGEYMKIMGKTLSLDEEACETLCMAAMLHDVGKLKVPDRIIEKPGKLTSEEFDEIKKHVQYGRDLLKNCPGEMMKIGKVIAYQHHEKWDGSGYLGMKEDEIDTYAALVAVIDVFDALVSKRSYKEAWGHEEAYNEIIRCTGTHFSPHAVEIFKKTYPELIKVLEKYPD